MHQTVGAVRGNAGTIGTPGAASTSYGIPTLDADLGPNYEMRRIPITAHGPDGLQEMAQQVAVKVKETAEHLKQDVSAKAASAASTLNSWMHEAVPLAHKIRHTLASVAHEVRVQHLAPLADNAAGVIQKHPVPTAVTGLLVGFVLARTIRR